MPRIFALLTSLLAFAEFAHGQAELVPITIPDTPYNLTAYFGAGYVRNLSEFDTPVEGVNQNGLAGTLRVMWKPEYLLSAGLEVAFSHVYTIEQSGVQTEFGTTDLSSINNAWTVLAVFSMSPFPHAEVNVGLGPAISTSEVESFGEVATASGFGSAFMISGGYLVPISPNLRLGGELKFVHINKYVDNNLSLQVVLAYKFLEY